MPSREGKTCTPAERISAVQCLWSVALEPGRSSGTHAGVNDALGTHNRKDPYPFAPSLRRVAWPFHGS